MSLKTTAWLAGIAVALCAYIFLVDLRRSQTAERVQEATRVLPKLDVSKVSSVEIVRSNQTLRAELVDGAWQLTNPAYPAQSTMIDTFLAALASLHREHEIPAQEIISNSGGLSPFGLDPPEVTIKIQSGSDSMQLRVGSKTLVTGRVYVQPVGAAGIFTTDPRFLQFLPNSLTAWRNPLLITRGNLTFDRIAITAGARPLKLERDNTNQLWRLVDPMQTRADFSRVEYLIQQLRNARVSQFITDDPKTDLDAYGFQSPEAELTLGQGSNAVFQVQFGKSPSNDASQVYARRVTQSNIVLVSRELADLVEKPYTEFRDRALLSFRAASVDRIDARADEAFALQRRRGAEWQIVEPFQAPADAQLVRQLLENLANLEIVRFEKDVVTDFSPYGLVKPARQYVLRTAATNSLETTNRILAHVDFGLSPTNEWDKVYCRRSDENSVYVVPEVGRLQRAAFALRDRRIWSFAGSNVVAATVLQHGQKKEMHRENLSRKWFADDEVNNAAVEETLHRLGELQAEVWVARGEDQARTFKVDGSEYQLVLEVTENGTARKYTLNLRLGAQGQPYGAVTLEQHQPVIFKIPINLYALILRYFSVPAEAASL